MKIDLTGRSALVTGASRGIGREIALALAGAGAKVACLATNEELLKTLAAEIGPNALPLKCDVSSPPRSRPRSKRSPPSSAAWTSW